MLSFLKSLLLLNMYFTMSSLLQVLTLLSLCNTPTTADTVPFEHDRDGFEEGKEYGKCSRVGHFPYDVYTIVGHNLQVDEEDMLAACKGRYQPRDDDIHAWVGIDFVVTKWKFEETWENGIQDFVATVRSPWVQRVDEG